MNSLLTLAFAATLSQTPTWKERVDDLAKPFVAKGNHGLVVGISTADGKREFFLYGQTKAGADAPTADTIFEIGSISKPITALLLALMAEAGEVKLDDPVRDHLPKDWTIPQRGDRDITLAELSTHTSGLPRLPPNLLFELTSGPLLGKSNADPYGAFDRKKLIAGLQITKVKDAAKPKVTYSNFGTGLLGEALSHRTNTSFENLIRDRIAKPLGLKNTFITTPDDLANKSATGHTGKGEPVADWTFATLAGAGAIRSTAADLLKFLEFQNGRRPSKLESAMKLTQERREMVSANMDIGLGWFIKKHDDRTYWWHNGGTGGFSSYAAFARNPAVAVVVLSNVARGQGLNVDEIGERLIDDLMRD